MHFLYYNELTGETSLTFHQVQTKYTSSVSPDDQQVGVFKRYASMPLPNVGRYETVVELPPVNGLQNWEVRNLPNTQVRERLAEDRAATRVVRDLTLRQCDWTMLPDTDITPEKKAEWKQYRQALRELNCDIPFDKIEWPTPPSA